MHFARNEHPPLLRKYQLYKPYLRKDFLFRCAYCLIHEAHYGGLRNFHVDHFRPKNRPEFYHLSLFYLNLYYACSLCNTFKGAWWPSDADFAAGRRFIDPCKEDAYEKHFELNQSDGTLRALTAAGEYTLEHIWLNREQLKKHRSRQTEAKRRLQECRALLETPGLPQDWLTKARLLMDEIEHECLNPAPPYEPEDVGS
jgi:hypothetical protein